MGGQAARFARDNEIPAPAWQACGGDGGYPMFAFTVLRPETRGRIAGQAVDNRLESRSRGAFFPTPISHAPRGSRGEGASFVPMRSCLDDTEEEIAMSHAHKASGTPIACTPHGCGPEGVLVLHDWNGDHTNYDAMLAYLDTSTFSYAFADLRGFGRSRDVAGQYTLTEILRDCLNVADALGWRRFHIIGHSMTGIATQRIARGARERLKCAVVARGEFFLRLKTQLGEILCLWDCPEPRLSQG